MAGELDERVPLVNIVGERVALGPARRGLLPLVQRWDNDFFAQRTQGRTPLPLTLDQERVEYDRAPPQQGQSIAFIIYRRADWQPLGFTAWKEIDYRNRTATFVIGIGEAAARGQGYGTEATRLMLDYAFTALGLHNVWLTVYEYNRAGQRAYQKAGFRELGRRRQAQWMGGRLWDVIIMECLASEFSSPVLGTVFVPDPPRG